VRQTVSVLAGAAGTDRWIVTGALFIEGLAYLALAVGLTTVGLIARVGLAAAALCAIGIAASPEPAHGGSTRHLILTGVGAVLIAVWPAMVPRRASPEWAIRGVRISTLTLAAFVALLAWTVIETHHGNTLGLAERLSSAIQVCWPVVVAYALRRRDIVASNDPVDYVGGLGHRAGR
jgi:hypothetical protein